VAFADGRRVPTAVVGGLVEFTLNTRRGAPADWAVT
jgi:hypothetical protein